MKEPCKILLLGICLIAADTFAQEKITPRIDLQYFQSDSARYLVVTARQKVDRRFEPVAALDVDLTIESDNGELPLGVVTTNEKGNGKLMLSNEIKSFLEEKDLFVFSAKAGETLNTEEVSETISITPGQLILSVDESDSRVINIMLQSRTGGQWHPVEDAEIKVFVKRTFGNLPIGEEAYSTDENGKVELPFEMDIPGDDEGRIIIGCSIEEHEELGNLKSHTMSNWGIPFAQHDGARGRTLWSPRDATPVWLLIVPNLMLAGVFGVVVYLVVQIFRMTRDREAKTLDL